MEDDSIVNLYWARSENAISETSKKYGDYCYSIAYGILGNAEDAAESVKFYAASPSRDPLYIFGENYTKNIYRQMA